MEKIKVCGVKFDSNGKNYYFDKNNLTLNINDKVVVETVKGIEIGIVSYVDKEVGDASLPLSPIIRIASEEDLKNSENNLLEAQKAMPKIKDLAVKNNLKLKVVSASYTLDKQKLFIEFTADDRVDFRQFVRDLGSTFRTKIELRQIGPRDETKNMGGIGMCGRECCCHKFLNNFDKVSIKMAKNQNLSLNPTKISGLCGKLMCCLEYENGYYEEELKKMPRVKSIVMLKSGERGMVTYNDLIRELVTIKIDKDDGSYENRTITLDDIVK
jgi:cell fate regulator YaaT (PSP1 superfamily)